MKRNRPDVPKLRPPRPTPVEIPADAVIIKCPPGRAAGANDLKNWGGARSKPPSYSGAKSPRKKIKGSNG
jgi:hypothetical protein